LKKQYLFTLNSLHFLRRTHKTTHNILVDAAQDVHELARLPYFGAERAHVENKNNIHKEVVIFSKYSCLMNISGF